MSEHYVASDIHDIPLTLLGNPKYRGWLPSEFGADKQYWEKKGVNPRKLLNDTYLNQHTGRQTGVHQTMSGVPVDTIKRSDAFQTMYQNLSRFLHLSIWKLKLKSTISSAKSSRTTSSRAAKLWGHSAQLSACKRSSALC